MCIHPVYMAKLYWRVKIDDKWTWKAATKDNSEIKLGNLKFFNLEYVCSNTSKKERGGTE